MKFQLWRHWGKKKKGNDHNSDLQDNEEKVIQGLKEKYCVYM